MADNPKPVSAADLNPQAFGPGGGSAGGLKYNVSMLQYPSSVGADSFYQHYVGFFINIRGKSKWKNSYKTQEITKTDENRLNTDKLGSATNGINAVAAGAVGAKLGTSLAGKILGNVGKTKTATKVIGLAAGAIGGAAAGAAAATLFEPDKTYRIDSAIMLAVSERPRVSYGVNYTETDLGIMGGIVGGGSSAVDTTRMGMAPEIAHAVALNAAKIPADIASGMGAADIDMKSMSSLGTGTAQNPFREQVFKSVSARHFNFNYKFLPRNATEVQSIQNIINMFKFHMHPELSSHSLFYIYPSQFNIVYYYAGKENKFINKISTCVLESMSVDYGGSGQFSTFADGSPTEYNVSLRFLELETLTKERVAPGVGY